MQSYYQLLPVVAHSAAEQKVPDIYGCFADAVMTRQTIGAPAHISMWRKSEKWAQVKYVSLKDITGIDRMEYPEKSQLSPQRSLKWLNFWWNEGQLNRLTEFMSYQSAGQIASKDFDRLTTDYLSLVTGWMANVWFQHSLHPKEYVVIITISIFLDQSFV